MVDADGPMGPDQKTWGGWWSVLRTLGSDHPRVRDSHQMMWRHTRTNLLDHGSFERRCPLSMHIYAPVNKVLCATVIIWSRCQVIPFGPYLKEDFNYVKLNHVNFYQLCQVIPFGPYLEDDFNYAKLNYVRLFAQARADSVMITIKASDWQLDKTDYWHQNHIFFMFSIFFLISIFSDVLCVHFDSSSFACSTSTDAALNRKSNKKFKIFQSQQGPLLLQLHCIHNVLCFVKNILYWRILHFIQK